MRTIVDGHSPMSSIIAIQTSDTFHRTQNLPNSVSRHLSTLCLCRTSLFSWSVIMWCEEADGNVWLRNLEKTGNDNDWKKIFHYLWLTVLHICTSCHFLLSQSFYYSLLVASVGMMTYVYSHARWLILQFLPHTAQQAVTLPWSFCPSIELSHLSTVSKRLHTHKRRKLGLLFVAHVSPQI